MTAPARALRRLDRELTRGAGRRLRRELVARREGREPLAYVLGEWGFRRLTLNVDRRALIPRPETESSSSAASRCSPALDEPRVLDVGIGSGAIALAIADEHPGARVTAIDSRRRRSRSRARTLQRTGLTAACGSSSTTSRGLGGPTSTSSSRTRRTSSRTSCRRWSPRCATGSRASRSSASGATEELARAARRRFGPAAGSCSRSPRATGTASSDAIGLRLRDVPITPDLAGRDRVAEGRWPL